MPEVVEMERGVFARIAGAVTLGGAFYTATYITSYPNGTPAYAILALLAGTVAGILACALPRSGTWLTVAAVLVGFGFSAAVINSGIAFGPGFVMTILAARQARRTDYVPHGEVFTGVRAPIRQAWEPEQVVEIPEAENVIVVPETDQRVAISSNGRAQAGPPGVFGVVGPPRKRGLSGSGGFR